MSELTKDLRDLADKIDAGEALDGESAVIVITGTVSATRKALAVASMGEDAKNSDLAMQLLARAHGRMAAERGKKDGGEVKDLAPMSSAVMAFIKELADDDEATGMSLGSIVYAAMIVGSTGCCEEHLEEGIAAGARIFERTARELGKRRRDIEDGKEAQPLDLDETEATRH